MSLENAFGIGEREHLAERIAYHALDKYGRGFDEVFAYVLDNYDEVQQQLGYIDELAEDDIEYLDWGWRYTAETVVTRALTLRH